MWRLVWSHIDRGSLCLCHPDANGGPGVWPLPPGCPALGVPVLLLACRHSLAFLLRWLSALHWAETWGGDT